MLQLRYAIDGEEKVLALSAPEIRLGRSADNQVVLPDYSVSRRHAVIRRTGDEWWVDDLQSTNGVQVNETSVESSRIEAGDLLKIGVFEIGVFEAGTLAAGTFEADASRPRRAGAGRRAGASAADAASLEETRIPGDGVAAPPRPPRSAAAAPGAAAGASRGSPSRDAAISNATIVRSLADISATYGLYEPHGLHDSGVIRQSKREALDQAYASQVFGWLTKLARTLITTDSDDEILEHVLAIAFELLPVDRGFILLKNPRTGALDCELVRNQDRVEFRPQGVVPISRTMLEAVIRERVALMTYDALSDQRLAGTESVRIHQIRAAMCTPLWAGEKIIGVMQLDTPHHTGSFTEPDVDLLATLANYCAVAIERNAHAREAEYERQVRSRLERYHSPAVIEEVMSGSGTAEGFRSLKQAEVTVLFADLVGFTAFSEEAAPEEVAELMEGYFTCAVEAIFSFGGTLDKFIGDCVMAFFGAPMKQPDHASRAVQAAVRICEGLETWNADRRRRGLPDVAIRIGINTGPVVVGDIGSKERVDYTVLGNTVNVAARLEETVAQAGDIVLGDATYRQVAGEVAAEPLGEVLLKGLSRRIPVHRVLRAGRRVEAGGR
jgi:adenylate cyclase